MRVEYIQAVCPYCNHGLRGYGPIEYHCHEHGDIEPRLVRHIVCEYQDGTVLMPAPYVTDTETSIAT